MTSKEIYNYLQQNKVDQLYKIFAKSFAWIDEWSEKMLTGDLLDENELAYMLDKSTAIYAKLCSVVNALESYMERVLNNEESKFYQAQEKVRTQDTSQAKALARSKVSDVRDYLADFKSYFLASQQMIVSAQSRLKRLTIDKGARGIDYTGEIPVEETVISDDLIEDGQKAWDSE